MNKLLILTMCLVGFAAARELKGKSGGFSCSKSLLTDPTVLEAKDMVLMEVESIAVNATAGALFNCDNGEAKLKKACSQVVAGTNYKLSMDVSCPGAKKKIPVKATVFVPLPSNNGGAGQVMEITSLTVLGEDLSVLLD